MACFHKVQKEKKKQKNQTSFMAILAVLVIALQLEFLLYHQKEQQKEDLTA